MYRHLLVPLDSGDLAFEVVGRALAVARPLGARVTFFHALEEAGAGGTPELLRLASPELRDTRRTGRTRELLAKAEAGARALGIPCEAYWSRGQAPAAATIAAARALGCDVIFLAPERDPRRTPAIGSVTLSVLAGAGLPVLVAPIADAAPEQRAIIVIRDEHRAIAAVIHACTSLLAAARESGSVPQADALRAALGSLRAAPLGQHHEKEERHLFARLRERSNALDAELDELQRQHARDEALLDELAMRLAALGDADGATLRSAATRALEQAIERFAELHWDHMGREEAVLLPAARELLQPADWEGLNAAFQHAAPGGPELDFRSLLARIA
jgi:nucleotide-binding universal stress UspA family protein/hemerythrin-like domain-containing protein